MHQYESVEQIQGILCQEKYADPSTFERAHYIRTLRSYKEARHPRPV